MADNPLLKKNMAVTGVTPHSPASPYRMTALERRTSLSLAATYALRMLGLFLVLPVFALEAAKYPGGDDPALMGLAMGGSCEVMGITLFPLERQGCLRSVFLLAIGRIAWPMRDLPSRAAQQAAKAG